MEINELKDNVFNLRNGLEEDQRNLADEMEALDPAAKEFTELDFEYNNISGQIMALNYVLALMEK